MKILKTPLQAVYSGVQISDKEIVFNYDEDNDSKDVVSLSKSTAAVTNLEGVQYYFAYRYNKKATAEQKKVFRNYIKGLTGSDDIYEDTVHEFVEHGVNRLDAMKSVKSFQAIVSIEPTTSGRQFSVISMIRNCLSECSDVVPISFELIKQAYEDVEFDSDKVRVALEQAGYEDWQIENIINSTVQKFNQLKYSGELFQMKKFLPRVVRDGFTNFLKFKNASQRRAYENLQGVDILIYDDFYTSGATVREIIRYLKSINDRNTLTVFVLIKQH